MSCFGWPFAGRGAELGRGAGYGRGSGPSARPGEELDRDGRLSGYRYAPAAKADLLRRLGRRAEAVAAYQAAIDLCDNDTERDFLMRRIAELA